MYRMNSNLKATKVALMQSKFHRAIKHRLNDALKPFDLASVDWIILGFLEHRKRPMVMTEVAAELGIPSSFMTTIVMKLSSRKLITVAEDKIDRRKKYISLAGEGRKVVGRMQRQFEEFFVPLMRGLSRKDLFVYLNVLKTIIDNIEQSGKL